MFIRYICCQLTFSAHILSRRDSRTMRQQPFTLVASSAPHLHSRRIVLLLAMPSLAASPTEISGGKASKTSSMGRL